MLLQQYTDCEKAKCRVLSGVPFVVNSLLGRQLLISIKALIADDHDAVRRGVRSVLLMRQDIDVCAEASDGREAIAKALESHPDIIILDLTMPVMGGFEAAVELRHLLPEVPILFYSMHYGKQLMEAAKQVGVRGFVSKTQIADTLLQAIDALVLEKRTYFPA